MGLREAPPLLKLRVREASPIGNSKTIETQPFIVEVISNGLVIGQLPATKAVYEALPNEPGKLSINFFATDVDIQTHD